MSNGVKLVFRKGGDVLAVDCGPDGWNLPSARVLEDEGPKDAASFLFRAVAGKAKEDLVPLHRGMDDEFAVASSFTSSWSGSPSLKGTSAKWMDPRAVLCGKWGLHAVDAFNKLGIMKRPRLRIAELYRISRDALSRSGAGPGKAIDLVMDEVALLMDIGKPWAVDHLLRKLDVRRLHADVVSAIQAAVEDIELPAKESFNQAAAARITQVDGRRTKIRYGVHEDVRAAALKVYRNTGAEFGQALRDGTLSARFPYMQHIAEAEAKIKRGERDVPKGREPVVGSQVPPLSEWPESYRAPVSPRADLVEEFDPYKPGPRGVCLEKEGPRRVTWFETTSEGRFRVEQSGDDVYRTMISDQESEFSRQIRGALDKGLAARQGGIGFGDGPDEGPAWAEGEDADGPDEGPGWVKEEE